MNRPFSSGRNKLVGFGRTYPVPIPLDPAVHHGAVVVGLDPADGKRKLYFSDGTEWTRSIFDTNVSETIERLVSDILLNGFDEEDLPDPTLSENLRRYAFNNTRGLPGFVWGNQWNYLADEARVAEIAAEVSANVFRVLGTTMFMTINRNLAEVEGENYHTLSAALEFSARYTPPFSKDWAADGQTVIQIHIEAAHGPLREQVFLSNVSLGHVFITAEDPEVEVDAAYLTRATDALSGEHAFFGGNLNAVMPQVYAVVFKCVNIGAVPIDGLVEDPYTPIVTGMSASAGSSGLIVGGVNRIDNVEAGPVRPAGFIDFHRNLNIGFGSNFGVYNSKFDDALDIGIQNQGALLIYSSTAKNCVTNGLLSQTPLGQTWILGPSGANTAYPGGFGNDFRRTVGIDTADDIKVNAGGFISYDSGRGGTSIPLNTSNVAGRISSGAAPLRDYTRDNLIGAVSQTAGVPTGAVFQWGSNANGTWVRYADGTQICFQNLATTTVINTPSSLGLGGLSDTEFEWTFPAAFVPNAGFTHPVVIPQNYSFDPECIPIRAAYEIVGGLATTAKLRFWRASLSATPQDFAIFVLAIGRWY